MSKRKGAAARPLARFVPRFEWLEDRSTPATFTVNALTDTGAGAGSSGDLRYCLNQANAAGGADTINFAVTGTVALGGTLTVTDDLTIDGPGADQVTLSGNDTFVLLACTSGGTDLTFDGLTLTRGGGSLGGTAVEFVAGTLTLDGCRVVGNTGTGQGGPINAINSDGLVMRNCEVAGNDRQGEISAGVVTNNTAATLTNCTIAGNQTYGVYVWGTGGTGSAMLLNCTLSGQSADIAVDSLASDAFLTLRNTILVSTFGIVRHNTDSPGVSTVTSLGNNIVRDGTLGADAVASDLQNTDPLLAPLGFYGGPTRTLPVLPGSPAIDAANTGAAPAQDQRGVGRVGAADVGAFESRKFTASLGSGTTQATRVSTAFPFQLIVNVSSAFGEPVAGGRLTVSPPGSGASASFSQNPMVINSLGTASTGATANGTAGGYGVPVTARGVTNTVSFNLTNTVPTTTVVTSDPTITFSPSSRNVTLSATVTAPQGTPGAGTVTFAIPGAGANVNASVVNGVATATFTVNGNVAAGSYSITASYSGSGQFEADASSGTDNGVLTIEKADQTIAFTVDSPVVYGVEPITLTATAASGLPVSFTLISGPGTLDGNVLTVTGTGDIVIRADQPGNGNYNPAAPVQRTLSVTPAPLTVTTDDASKVYGQPNPAFTVAYTGFVNGDDPADLGGALAFDTPATAASGVGDYAVTPSGLTSANYEITFVDGTLSVTPAPLTVTADDQTKVYGAAVPALTFATAGLVNGDTPETVLTGALATAAADGSPVGTYAIAQGTLAANANYSLTFVDGTLTVTPAPLTVTTDDASKVYGQPNPAFTASFAGFVNGDDPADLGGALAFATPATTASGVGDYAVTPSGLTSANYEITFVDGTLSVTPAPLTVTADAASRLYGAADPAFTASFTGFVNGDSPADLGGALTFATPATVESGVGSYPITPSGLTSANYAITFADGTLTVTPAPLTVTADDAARFFGQPNPAFTATFTGFVNGDTPADLAGTLSLTTPAITSSPSGTYPITPSGLTSANYDITFVDGTLTVNPIVQRVAVGTGPGGGPRVQAYDDAGVLLFDFFAYDAGLRGGVSVATADVTGDGTEDVITGAGVGGGTHVKVFDGATGALAVSWFAYESSFRGGVWVASGDVDGDGSAEVITGPGQGGGPVIAIWTLAGGVPNPVASFLAFEESFRGGATVAYGRDAGGRPVIVAGAGAGGAPRVRTFDAATRQVLGDVFAFEPSFTGGVFVATGDVFGTGAGQQVLVGPGAGGGPRLRVLDLDGSARADLFAAVESLRNGLTVASLDRPTGPAAIVVGAGEGAFQGEMIGGALADLERVGFFGPGFQGGVFVG